MPRILIVDDQPLLTRLLELQLVTGGHEVVACNDGHAAVAALQRQPFDAVMLDLMMPPPDGFETCRLMRATEAGAHVPILFITGVHSRDLVERARLAGVDHVLGKPSTYDEVIACVATVIANGPHASR